MGMAASQARFLGLTARKNNVEFEGQQINQQRTCLSNQSANYYSDLLGMSVPVAPSVDDYTKTIYSFNDGALTNTITSLIAQNDGSGKYMVSYLQTWEDDFSAIAAGISVVTQSENNYKIGATTLRKLTTETTIEAGDTNVDIDTDTDTNISTETLLDESEYPNVSVAFMNNEGFFVDENGETNDYTTMYSHGTLQDVIDGNLSTPAGCTPVYYIYDSSKEDYDSAITFVTQHEDGKWYKEDSTVATNSTIVNLTEEDSTLISNEAVVISGVTTKDPTDLDSLTDEEKEAIQQEEEYYVNLLNEKYGTPKNGWYIRYVKNSSTGAYVPYFYNGDDCASESKRSSTKTYTIGTETKTKEVKGVEDCEIEKDSTGRYINITIPDGDSSTTYSLTTSTVTDEDAYNDAMNQYEYNKYKYDQTIQEINAKIEIIQSQDKNLELRLKQLDTEQEAISQETDAVTKVIEKNVESSFKTFG